MKAKDIILKKENKKELSSEEIKFIVDNFLNKKISKQEMIKFLETIYKNGMNEKETFYLTKIMAESGKILKFSDKSKIYADKHSTGGISDSTTLIIGPIIACAGISFLKMSGRKLGYTGGTADKLECFKNYNTNISLKEAERLVSKNGASLLTQTEDLAPADKYIYKLRDETNTIMSIPLIASSVMSKKLAIETGVLVLDVKCGDGAFMRTKKDAIQLSKSMLEIGIYAGKKVCAVISDMNQPLGHNVGSLVEVIESIEVLKGKKGRLRDLSIFLSAKIIEMGKNISCEEAIKIATQILDSGKALEKFKTMVSDQGGSLDLFDDKYVKDLLNKKHVINSRKAGFISKFNLEKLGYLVREYCDLGNYGIKILVNLGDYVYKNSPIIELYGENSDLDFVSCLHFSKNKKTANNLIIKVL